MLIFQAASFYHSLVGMILNENVQISEHVDQTLSYVNIHACAVPCDDSFWDYVTSIRAMPICVSSVFLVQFLQINNNFFVVSPTKLSL